MVNHDLKFGPFGNFSNFTLYAGNNSTNDKWPFILPIPDLSVNPGEPLC